MFYSGFSTVDLIESRRNKKTYALKRITCHSLEDQKLALQEIEYYKKIKHPNIIELVDSTFKGKYIYLMKHKKKRNKYKIILGSADIVVNATSEAYLVLPYYSRGTLHDYLGLKSLSKDYLDVKDVLRMFLDICDAVKYLHQFTPEPLAHRDIKTANICLSNNFNPILMDLGK